MATSIQIVWHIHYNTYKKFCQEFYVEKKKNSTCKKSSFINYSIKILKGHAHCAVLYSFLFSVYFSITFTKSFADFI